MGQQPIPSSSVGKPSFFLLQEVFGVLEGLVDGPEGYKGKAKLEPSFFSSSEFNVGREDVEGISSIGEGQLFCDVVEILLIQLCFLLLLLMVMMVEFGRGRLAIGAPDSTEELASK